MKFVCNMHFNTFIICEYIYFMKYNLSQLNGALSGSRGTEGDNIWLLVTCLFKQKVEGDVQS